MCGIAAIITSSAIPPKPEWPFWAGSAASEQPGDVSTPKASQLRRELLRRGPDACGEFEVDVVAGTSIHLVGTVLAMRGTRSNTFPEPVVSQPMIDKHGNVLLFNGEIYDGFDATDDVSDVSDSLLMLKYMETRRTDGDPLGYAKLDKLRGPWSIIFWRSCEKRLYFGRDKIGRRSLLIQVIPGQSIVISSSVPAGTTEGFVETPTNGLAYIDFSCSDRPEFGVVGRVSTSVIPRRADPATHEVQQIVAGSSTDMYISFLPPQWLRSSNLTITQSCLSAHKSAELFLDHFRRSIVRRLVTHRKPTPEQSRYAVLFSGGIDSLVIAAMLEECLPRGESLHLVNVAFGADADAIAVCPDRITAISGLFELRKRSRSNRKIDLLCVDVSPDEADAILEGHVRHLLHPCDRPMDASIGTALWLAARAQGAWYRTDEYKSLMNNSVADESTARILLSGLGADELMGGYKGRHRTIFRNEGVEGIKREMDADLSRLWFRNLGRDDRLISDHGKEVRHPFLDEDLITFVTGLPLVEHVCDLSKPDGVGDKHLLRRAAALMGISAEATSRAKRAIQFGSRSKKVIERKKT